MRRVFGKGRTRAALGVGAAVTAVIAGTTLLTGGATPAKGGGAAAVIPATGGPSPAALQSLTEMLHQQHIGPAIRVPSPGPQAEISGATPVTSLNWSGFADTGRTFAKVAASWVQPTVTCHSNEDELAVFWVGLDGAVSTTVEQDGTIAQCEAGVATYYSWWEMYPTNDIQVVGTTVRPGDQITSRVNVAAGKYTLTVTDSTHPANSFTETQTCQVVGGCPNSSAEWIAETPGTQRGETPWPAFGTWKVANATVSSQGGVNGVISTFPVNRFLIQGVRNNNLATLGPLNAGGNGFSDTWLYAW